MCLNINIHVFVIWDDYGEDYRTQESHQALGEIAFAFPYEIIVLESWDLGMDYYLLINTWILESMIRFPFLLKIKSRHWFLENILGLLEKLFDWGNQYSIQIQIIIEFCV